MESCGDVVAGDVGDGRMLTCALCRETMSKLQSLYQADPGLCA